jgi:hypothetical protein
MSAKHLMDVQLNFRVSATNPDLPITDANLTIDFERPVVDGTEGMSWAGQQISTGGGAPGVPAISASLKNEVTLAAKSFIINMLIAKGILVQ